MFDIKKESYVWDENLELMTGDKLLRKLSSLDTLWNANLNLTAAKSETQSEYMS